MDAYPTFAFNGFVPTANAVYPLFSTCGITGTTPGTAGAAPSLFLPMPQGIFQHMGLKKLMMSLTGVNASAGSINWYKSSNRGTTWIQLGTQAITFATNAENFHEFDVEPYPDFKVDFNNSGGTNQTASWSIHIAGSPERAAAI